jgi:hypothetical protein
VLPIEPRGAMTHNQPTYKIEKGIEISRRGNARIYPFDQLEPGGQFLRPRRCPREIIWPDKLCAEAMARPQVRRSQR